jgi:transposase
MRRETAEQFGLSPIVAIKQQEALRRRPPAEAGRPLDEHEDFILGLIKEQPDVTLDEIVATLAKAKMGGSRTAVWRFLDRHGITYKKNSLRRGAKTGGGGPRAPALRAGHA